MVRLRRSEEEMKEVMGFIKVKMETCIARSSCDSSKPWLLKLQCGLKKEEFDAQN